jgi:hypothetical protein
MAVELIPLTMTELGMTRAEILEYSTSLFEHMRSFVEMFFVMLFAYSVAMFVAGSQLTVIQYGLANFMYICSIGLASFATVANARLGYDWQNLSNIPISYSADIWVPPLLGIFQLVMVVASVWFGRHIRHAAQT